VIGGVKKSDVVREGGRAGIDGYLNTERVCCDVPPKSWS
jgi:hypothetical protein